MWHCPAYGLPLPLPPPGSFSSLSLGFPIWAWEEGWGEPVMCLPPGARRL